MAFPAKVYRVFIASPSDTTEEREAAYEAILEWNVMNSEHERIVLLPVRWETDAVPEAGERPQGILNRQLLRTCDILVGIFWTKFGFDTGVAASATAEEIAEFEKAGKAATTLLYFSERQADVSKVDPEQMQKLREFKKKTYANALAGSFSSLDELKQKLSHDLTIHARRLGGASSPQHESATVDDDANDRAMELRKEFEEGLIQGKFQTFPGKRGVLAIVISPTKPPKKLIDLAALMAKKELQRNDWFYPLGERYGRMTHDIHSISSVTEDAITELTDDGNILACDHWFKLVSDLNPNEVIRFRTEEFKFRMNVREPEILDGVGRYITLLKELGVNGPWHVGISLLFAQNLRLSPWDNYFTFNEGGRVQTQDFVLTDMMIVPDDINLADPQALPLSLKFVLDQFWRAFGFSRALSFDKETGSYVGLERR